MKIGEKLKKVNPYLMIIFVFMLIVIVANVAIWVIIEHKVDIILGTAEEGSDLTLDDATIAEIVEDTKSSVLESAQDSIDAQIARDFYLPNDYTSIGLYVASTNLYNVIELTCQGRQKTNINDNSTTYNISSQSTGTIVTDDGYVITNAHCVTFDNYSYTASGPFVQYSTYTDVYPSIVGKFTGHTEEYTFTVIAFDTIKDLALIKINEEIPSIWKKTTLANSDNVKMGEDVIAMGNAQGYGINMTSGIASKYAFYDEDYEEYLIQTDAAINPGNSGGALYNINAEIIGINSAKIVSSGVEGMGFAIASNSVKEFIDNVCADKGITVSYSYRES